MSLLKSVKISKNLERITKSLPELSSGETKRGMILITLSENSNTHYTSGNLIKIACKYLLKEE